jgi:hypothetical protein
VLEVANEVYGVGGDKMHGFLEGANPILGGVGVGLEIGEWLDDTFGISDKISDVTSGVKKNQRQLGVTTTSDEHLRGTGGIGELERRRQRENPLAWASNEMHNVMYERMRQARAAPFAHLAD